MDHQNADCSLKNKFIVVFVIIFGTLSLPICSLSDDWWITTAARSVRIALYERSGDSAGRDPASQPD